MTVPDRAAAPWTGRDDGPDAELRRWHHVVRTTPAESWSDVVFAGFASDEGVRRNKGRVGAAQGPAALRAALGGLALPGDAPTAVDAGDVVVADGDLAAGQERLAALIAPQLAAGRRTFVLGGGHAVGYASYRALVRSGLLDGGRRLGILNLDAHFDLRDDAVPSSGTPFLQIARDEQAAGRPFHYAVLGISQPANTERLFATARDLGVRHLPDSACGVDNLAGVDGFVDAFLDGCDLVHLTVDLDVLPAAEAPGVSAPAAYGVPTPVIERVCTRVAASGKLALTDVAELNPAYDVDARTARAAARLVHRTALLWEPLKP
ncbi:formimidoylglutamase [Streptomyces sp. VRA16 Mangrove soil]|uniref:formimidoylglutamase n=1 Tax=Streptomyces sp. VRA16 Mangrove soil TaxID=2817434 RepID=UPI001A9F115D|nr:formimidoylglutamase [Streptomyces sp. VRA16 Mangrove soil]MBO1332242.1 formimidoylglutamase [Streptomyces sp. VRA16 Mangrove soil]